MSPTIERRIRCHNCGEGAVIPYSDDRYDLSLVPEWTALIGRTSNIEAVRIGDLSNHDFNAYQYYCPHCPAVDHVSTCIWCEYLISEDYEPGVYIYSEDAVVCLDCYEDRGFRCNDCGDAFHIELSNTVNEDYPVCERCLGEYAYCESCRNYMSHRDMVSSEDVVDMLEAEDREDELDDFDEEDITICTYCSQDRGWPTISRPVAPLYTRSSPGIFGYSYMPPTLMVHTPMGKEALLDFAQAQRGSRTRVFGWELEIESNSSSENVQARALEINTLEEGVLLYCKSDSSIRNGFEIVSHPGSFEFWDGKGREILEPLFEVLKANGYTSYLSGRCGLHIHTNRSAISRLHTYNLARFMHDRTCTPKLKKLSRREGTSNLDSYARLTLSDTFDRNTGQYGTPNPLEYAKQVVHGILIGDRGRAINLARRDTVELRLFRGSLNFVKFMGSLQFYKTMLEFTNPTAGTLKMTEKTRWLNYRNFVEDYPQPKAVRELKVILQEAGI